MGCFPNKGYADLRPPSEEGIFTQRMKNVLNPIKNHIPDYSDFSFEVIGRQIDHHSTKIFFFFKSGQIYWEDWHRSDNDFLVRQVFFFSGEILGF